MNKFIKSIGLDKITSNPIYLRFQNVIIPAVSGVICITIVVLIIIPQFLKYTNTVKDLNDINAQNQKYQEKLKTLSSIDKSKYNSNLQTALIALPAEQDIPGIASEITILLSTSSLKMEGISFSSIGGNVTANSSYKIKIDVTGTADNIQIFMDKTKTSPRILKVDSFDISGAIGKGNLEASIELTTFYQPLPNAESSTNASVPTITDKDLALLNSIKQNLTVSSQANVNNSTTPKGKADPFQ